MTKIEPSVEARDGDPVTLPAKSWRSVLEVSWVVGVVAFTLLRFFVARETLVRYGLNLWVFGAIDLLTAVPYAVGVARVVGATVDHDGKAARRWVVVAAASFLAPYAYIAIAGRDASFPPAVYAVLGVLILIFGANAAMSVARKVRIERKLHADRTT